MNLAVEVMFMMLSLFTSALGQQNDISIHSFPTPAVFAIGVDFTIACGYPTERLTFQHFVHPTDGSVSLSRGRFAVKYFQHEVSLTVSNGRESDAGMYYCVFLEGSAAVIGPSLSIRFPSSIILISQNSNITVQAGSDVNLTCDAEHFTSRQWLFESADTFLMAVANSSDLHRVVTPDFHLQFRGIQLEDQGVYTCALSNEIGGAEVVANISIITIATENSTEFTESTGPTGFSNRTESTYATEHTTHTGEATTKLMGTEPADTTGVTADVISKAIGTTTIHFTMEISAAATQTEKSTRVVNAVASSVASLLGVILLFLLLFLLYCYYRRRTHKGTLTIHPRNRRRATSLPTDSYRGSETPQNMDPLDDNPLYDVIPSNIMNSPSSDHRHLQEMECEAYQNDHTQPSQWDDISGSQTRNAGTHHTLNQQVHSSDCETAGLQLYDTIATKHPDVNEATYSSLKFNFKSEHETRPSACIRQQEKCNAAVTENTATEPDQAQYRSLHYSAKISCLPADQYDTIASNNPSTGDTVPTYSTLGTKSIPPSNQAQGQDNLPQDPIEQIHGTYDVIKSENVDRPEPVYSVVNKAKKNRNYSMITADDLTASLLSDSAKKESEKPTSYLFEEEML